MFSRNKGWEFPNLETSQPKKTRNTLHILIGMLLSLGLVVTSTMIVIQNQQIIHLENKNSNLQSEYAELLLENEQLQTNYDQLLSDYNELFSDYEILRNAFENPLYDPDVPTYREVVNWLAIDDTDEHAWVDGVWSCGDFSAMLMTRAKEMNWRVRIAIIFYS